MMFGSSKMDEYRHLDQEPIDIRISMDDLADLIVNKENYGAQRLLSAIVRKRREHENYKRYDDNTPTSYKHRTEALAALLNQGWY